jgi:hypothetical protein
MRRRVFLAALLGAVVPAGPALARDRSNDIVRQLKKNGYRIVDVSRTFLGRVRILASRKGGQREIIVNPSTGEILRDLWLTREKGGADQGDWDDWEDDDLDDNDRDDDDDGQGDDQGGGSDDDSDGDSGGDSGGGSGNNSGEGGGDDD